MTPPGARSHCTCDRCAGAAGDGGDMAIVIGIVLGSFIGAAIAWLGGVA